MDSRSLMKISLVREPKGLGRGSTGTAFESNLFRRWCLPPLLRVNCSCGPGRACTEATAQATHTQDDAASRLDISLSDRQPPTVPRILPHSSPTTHHQLPTARIFGRTSIDLLWHSGPCRHAQQWNHPPTRTSGLTVLHPSRRAPRTGTPAS